MTLEMLFLERSSVQFEIEFQSLIASESTRNVTRAPTDLSEMLRWALFLGMRSSEISRKSFFVRLRVFGPPMRCTAVV
jgi:hypothetical protein